MLKPQWWVDCAGMAKRKHLCVHLSIYLSSVPLHLSISQSIYLSIYRSSYSVYLDCAGMAKRKHLSIHPSIYPFYLSSYHSLNPSMFLSIYFILSIYLSRCSSRSGGSTARGWLSVSIYPSIYLSSVRICLLSPTQSIYVSIDLSILFI